MLPSDFGKVEEWFFERETPVSTGLNRVRQSLDKVERWTGSSIRILPHGGQLVRVSQASGLRTRGRGVDRHVVLEGLAL